MTFWHQQTLVDAHLSELRRHARDRHAASARAASDRRGRPPGIQQRLGVLLVETGLYLITRTDRGRLKARPSS